MAITTPTDPTAYDSALVRQELTQIQAVLPKLQVFSGREFRELPQKLQDEVRAIKTIVTPTRSGLEKMVGIIWQLWNSEEFCKKILNGESVEEFLNAITGTDPVPTMNTNPVPAGEATTEPSQPTKTATLNVAPATLTDKSGTLSISTDAATPSATVDPVTPTMPADSGTIVISK